MSSTIAKHADYLSIYCDGAVGEKRRATGLGVIIRDERNEIIGLVKRGMPAMSSVEAEYAALVLALEAIQPYQPRHLQIYSDNQVVIGQMQGRFAVNSPRLKRWHIQACRLAHRYQAITYHHIPRDENRLADALANEALQEQLTMNNE
jgi:ribonuclease HI